MKRLIAHFGRCVVTSLFVAAVPFPSWAGIDGDWEVRVNEVVKKASPENPDELKTRIVFEYRYHGGLPQERFLVAVANSLQAIPQTIKQYSDRRYAFNLPQANVYEVCPHQFELIEDEGDVVGRGYLALQANIDFDPRRTPGLAFQQVILHDWGNVYEGLGGVSQFNFGTLLDTTVLSAGLMMREGRCKDATVDECIEIVSESVRELEPTEAQLAQGIFSGQTFFRCGADDTP